MQGIPVFSLDSQEIEIISILFSSDIIITVETTLILIECWESKNNYFNLYIHGH